MYIINIPQGSSGRLKLEDCDYYQIKGLYTSGFSTCNILACIGENRLSLFHFDSFSSILQFNDDLEWVLESNAREETNIVVIYRDIGKELKEMYQVYLQDLANKHHQVIEKLIDNKRYDGIFISFNSVSKYNYNGVMHDNISILINNIKPLGTMVHHPLEEQFVTTRKINQLTGLQQKKQLYDNYIATGTMQAFNDHCIFLSGSMWQHISQKHLVIDTQDPFVISIMENFSKRDSYLEIAKKINPIAEKIQLELRFDYITSMTPIAINIEEYLHNYNYLEIFKHNIKSLTVTDTTFKDRLYSLLENSDNFIEIKKFIADNIFQFSLEQPPLIKYFEQHYTARSIYDDLRSQYTMAEYKAKSFIAQGDQYFACKQYKIATEKYIAAADAFIVRAICNNNIVEKIKERLKIAYGKLEENSVQDISKFFLPLQQNQQQHLPCYLNSKLFQGCQPPPGNHKIQNSRTVILSP